MPITLTDPRTLTPTFYKMFYRRVQCKHCGLVHSYDQVMAAVQVQGGYTYVPCKTMADIQYNIPVKVETMAVETSPWCHMCFNPDLLRHLPKADPQKQRPISPSWAGTGLNPAGKPAKASKPTKPAKKVWTGTVDDLDID